MPSAIIPGIYDDTLAKDNLWAPTEVCYEIARDLARDQGILVGHSSGANLWAAREVGAQIGSGVIVTILCDSGDRYLSSGLFGDRR